MNLNRKVSNSWRRGLVNNSDSMTICQRVHVASKLPVVENVLHSASVFLIVPYRLSNVSIVCLKCKQTHR